MNRQLEAWTGEFGDDYISRNDVTPGLIDRKIEAWSEIIRSIPMSEVTSILEVGSNIGLNLRALRRLTDATLFAVEPNESARARLIADKIVPAENVYRGDAATIPLSDGAVDLAFTSTVLIHVSPDHLLETCKSIHRSSRRFIVCNEYFSATPQEIEYRDHKDLLFKRDFGSFWMDSFPDLRLVDYGFLWKRAAAMDDTTWWVFEKA